MTHFVNPILNADWSDPDAIRVDDTYYMTASTFNRVPGLPVLRSNDLVQWELIGHALPRLVPEDHFSLPRRGCGVWAPAIRHHDGRFVIVYPDPDHGIFVITADDPAGPWSEPHLLYAASGVIDPCPFWDDDGRAYLVHGWARTRSGFSNILTMVEVTPDLSAVISPSRDVVDGDRLPGYSVLEGPKMHKRDGWYWIFAPAGSVPTGWQSAFRARDPWGPYEGRILLAQGDTNVNGPHQGAWVEGADGSDWFVHFQDRGPVGRVVHLQPMRWGADGWPRLGTAALRDDAGTEYGEPVPAGEGPTPTDAPAAMGIARSDDWSSGIGLQWFWQGNPREDWLTWRADGRLGLRTHSPDPQNLRHLPRILAQRLPGVAFEARTTIAMDGMSPGSRAGLVALGDVYGWVGLRQDEQGGMHLVVARGGATRDERDLVTRRLDPHAGTVHLRVRGDDASALTFGWSLDGETWTDASEAVPAASNLWTGAHLGVFATGTPESDGSGAGEAAFGAFEMSLAV